MDKRNADKIIITSNARMKQVLDWYSDNQRWLDSEPFCAPMESGVVELQEEELAFSFENQGAFVAIEIFPLLKPNLPSFVRFIYDPATKTASDFRFDPALPEERKFLLMGVIASDRTTEKEALKYHALMSFMAYYREEAMTERREVQVRNGIKKKKSRHVQPLVRRIYTVSDLKNVDLTRPKWFRRPYTKPDHSVNVRGFYRHYKKSGKTVWIAPTVRYKDKERKAKEYQL